jgi:hypothetical protein
LAYRVSGHVRYYTLPIFAEDCRRAAVHGALGLLEFNGWSFWVAVVAAAGRAVPPDQMRPMTEGGMA